MGTDGMPLVYSLLKRCNFERSCLILVKDMHNPKPPKIELRHFSFDPIICCDKLILRFLVCYL